MNLPSDENLNIIKEKNILIGSFNLNNNKEIINKYKNKFSIFSLEQLPRITRAQSMDILSSQANLAGYKAVIDSFALFKKAIPMMMTAAGTIPAAKSTGCRCRRSWITSYCHCQKNGGNCFCYRCKISFEGTS